MTSDLAATDDPTGAGRQAAPASEAPGDPAAGATDTTDETARDAVVDAADGAVGGANTQLRTPPERALRRAERERVDPAVRMRIGEVSDRLGLSLRSIRHYEDVGLVTPSARTTGGFRLYSELDVQRLLLIMQMKPLGFALDEMRQVLADLDVAGNPSPSERAGRHGEDIEDSEGVADVGDVAAARRRLASVSEDVDQRWADLHQRLHIAAMFRDHLADELGTPRPS
ncbi:MerR family transcriptional regulator [Agilicoccus flavus]|uniref:MerR family transcriptional regulator n=1 Tax=Agilicoccus flavus TaxID=2775968 RepID=UPI001CF65A86|nr:MerR family transcriptional regulator [Agilicoccus flavus]